MALHQPSSERLHGLSRISDSRSQVQDSLSKVSFGALAKAQDALEGSAEPNRKRKRTDIRDSRQYAHGRRDIEHDRSEKKSKTSKPTPYPNPSESKFKEVEPSDDGSSDDDSGSDTDSAASEENPRARSSKHAPASLPSNKPVSRRRTILNSEARRSRDPRFDHVSNKSGGPHAGAQYNFLHHYRTTEMDALREQIQQLKAKGAKGKAPAITAGEEEVLKQELRRMENRERARTEKERLADLQRKHRMQEAELVKQGKKKAFYLKKSELKKLALAEKFSEMKGREREKAMERKRKKQAAKEKKAMPSERRALVE